MPDFAHITLAANALPPDQYNTDREYFAAMTDRFGLQTTETIVALKCAGHTDISRFTVLEWLSFAQEYGEIVSKFVALAALNNANFD
ncbi:MAG: hypothetical protein AAF468_22260 [Pseudomonadota bacterium]